MTEPRKGQPLVTGLLRGLAVLRCFDLGRERLGSSEIARMTGLPQPTVWRLCKTLEHGGYLVADADGQRFRPGLPILTLGYAALDTLELAELARPLLLEISARFEGAASLSTRDGASMLYLQRCEAPRTVLTLNVRVGSEVPVITTGTGWAYLAGLPADERASVLSVCRKADPERYGTHEAAAKEAVAAYARHGFVENVDVFFPGLTTVAVPLATRELQVPYVLNCTSPSSVLSSGERRREVAAALQRAADQLRPVLGRLA
jgi:DNA-binding IclR family transcriptional regulator